MDGFIANHRFKGIFPVDMTELKSHCKTIFWLCGRILHVFATENEQGCDKNKKAYTNNFYLRFIFESAVFAFIITLAIKAFTKIYTPYTIPLFTTAYAGAPGLILFLLIGTLRSSLSSILLSLRFFSSVILLIKKSY